MNSFFPNLGGVLHCNLVNFDVGFESQSSENAVFTILFEFGVIVVVEVSDHDPDGICIFMLKVQGWIPDFHLLKCYSAIPRHRHLQVISSLCVFCHNNGLPLGEQHGKAWRAHVSGFEDYFVQYDLFAFEPDVEVALTVLEKPIDGPERLR